MCVINLLIIKYILIVNSQVLPIYSKILTDELNIAYLEKSNKIKDELKENISSQGTFCHGLAKGAHE
jgi:hypothetical protein